MDTRTIGVNLVLGGRVELRLWFEPGVDMLTGERVLIGCSEKTTYGRYGRVRNVTMLRTGLVLTR